MNLVPAVYASCLMLARDPVFFHTSRRYRSPPPPPQVGEMFGRRPGVEGLLDLPCDCGHAMERRGAKDVEGGPNQKIRPSGWFTEPMGSGMVLTLPHLATSCGVSGLQQRISLRRGEAMRCWR